MTKSELIQKLAEQNPHLYQRDAEQIVSTIFEAITDALENGDRVELRGFGAFSVKHRDARVGRNPRTGESVQVEAKRVPFFKTGKKLHERLNDAMQAESEAPAPAVAEESPEPSPVSDYASPAPAEPSYSETPAEDTSSEGGDDDNTHGGGGFSNF